VKHNIIITTLLLFVNLPTHRCGELWKIRRVRLYEISDNFKMLNIFKFIHLELP